MSDAAPSLPRRLLDTVMSPGRMAGAVAENPRWLGAMLVGAVLLGLSIAVLPWELFEAMQRRVLLESGRAAPEVPENVRTALRIGSIVGGALAFVIFSFIGAALSTFIYAFVLGDEGTYRQYLAVGVHAAIIPATVALLLAPLRITAGDPQLTLNVGTFMVFVPAGYLAGVLQALDFSQIWSALVAAQGMHAIDHRRSVRSAAAIQLGILLVIALIAGWFLARQG
ncbi:MAG: YIP1 family protein [Gemmatimonadota bacterium]|nr:YIP1 family protein [Gemmatimonadota bacterium]MDH3422940.1 YIP1 family protein [Gemmatimonadota bacterium]